MMTLETNCLVCDDESTYDEEVLSEDSKLYFCYALNIPLSPFRKKIDGSKLCKDCFAHFEHVKPHVAIFRESQEKIRCYRKQIVNSISKFAPKQRKATTTKRRSEPENVYGSDNLQKLRADILALIQGSRLRINLNIGSHILSNKNDSKISKVSCSTHKKGQSEGINPSETKACTDDFANFDEEAGHALSTKSTRFRLSLLDTHSENMEKRNEEDVKLQDRKEEFLSNYDSSDCRDECPIPKKKKKYDSNKVESLEQERPKVSMPKVPAGTLLKCEKCDWSSYNKKTYWEHVAYRHREPRFSCSVCSKKFSKKSELKCHFNALHEAKQCIVCSNTYENKDALNAHIKHEHPDDPAFKRRRGSFQPENIDQLSKCYICDACGFIAKDRKSMWEHKIKHQEPRFECQVCKRKFFKKSNCEAHYRKHHGPRKCPYCNIECRDVQDFTNHLKEIHGGANQFTCSACNRSFLLKEQLLKHEKDFHYIVGDKYLCYLCSEMFDTVLEVNEHKDKKHPDSKKPHHCKVCARSFTCGKYLRGHEKLHFREESHQCEECLKQYLSLKDLEKHKLIHERDKGGYKSRPIFRCSFCQTAFFTEREKHRHSKSCKMKQLKVEEMICPHCNQKFTWKKEFLKHLNFVHSDSSRGDLRCHICNRLYQTVHSLNIHNKQYHTLEFCCYCTQCGQGFASQNLLVKHERIHATTRLQCDSCPKSFKRPTELKIHQKIHSGELNHKCDICGKKLATQYMFNLHRETHNESKDYICELCGRAFKGPTGLHSHKRRAHQGTQNLSENKEGKSENMISRRKVITRRKMSPEIIEIVEERRVQNIETDIIPDTEAMIATQVIVVPENVVLVKTDQENCHALSPADMQSPEIQEALKVLGSLDCS